jgi:hypothetical protein
MLPMRRLAATSLLALLLPLPVSAQISGSPRPGYTPDRCRWLVPWGMEYLQPKKLPSREVAGKNARGCLSQNDASYASNGCPAKFCGYREIGPLPSPDDSVKLQLPNP